MKPYVLYDAEGRIVSATYQPDGIDPVVPSDLSFMYTDDFVHAPDEYYVAQNALTKKPAKPAGFYKWDYTNKAWVFDAWFAEIDARNKRGALLAKSDWTDLLSAQDRLGPEKYAEWQTYRQSLRDIPQQPGFPATIVWPVEPA